MSRSLILTRNANGDITGGFLIPLDLDYESEFVTYTGEINHIWEVDNNTLVVGARFQSGEFETRDRFDNPPSFAVPFFDVPPAEHNFDTSLERQSFYAYDTFRPFRSLSVTAGVSFDHLGIPDQLPQLTHPG